MNKIDVVGASAATHKEAMTDGAEVLRHLGGREIAALVGAIVGARLNRIPVILMDMSLVRPPLFSMPSIRRH